MLRKNRSLRFAAAAAAASAVESLENRWLFASTYAATLTPMNGSGVNGTATLTLDGNQLTVAITATGLEANQIHPQHIHGQFDAGTTGNAVDSIVPTAAADTDRDGFIEHKEATPSTGPAILPLSSPPGDDSNAIPASTLTFPTAAADGTITFTQTYDLSVATQFFDPETPITTFTGQDLLSLDLRVIELHGLTVPATAGVGTTGEVDGTAGYKTNLPVAAGEIQLVDDGSGGGVEGVFSAPAGTTGSFSTPVNWTEREAVFNNEVGYFLTDENGAVNGIAPGAAGWAEAALRSSTRQIMFASGAGAGATRTSTFSADDNVVFYIIQNNTTDRFLAENPTNTIGNGPLAFFSITAANPDNYAHARFTTTTTNGTASTEFRWEDLTNGGDEDFDDVVFTINLVDAVDPTPDPNPNPNPNPDPDPNPNPNPDPNPDPNPNPDPDPNPNPDPQPSIAKSGGRFAMRRHG